MSIENKKKQEDKFFLKLYPEAEDAMKKKTNAQLEKKMYELHENFARFAFSILSFTLYVPTLIELFQTSIFAVDYVRNIIILIILISLEVGLAYTLADFYIRKHSKNSNRRKIIAYTLAFTSIVFSAFSGINAIDIVDKSASTIHREQRTEIKEDIKEHVATIKRNDKKILYGNNLIVNNNKLMNELSAIAATKKGSTQISRYQTANSKNQKVIDNLIAENAFLQKEMKSIRNDNKVFSKTALLNAGKKELIYMIIFFISGIVAVGGLMYSYNFIALYKSYLVEDAEKIDVLKNEKTNKEFADAEKRIKKEILLAEMENKLNEITEKKK